MSSFYEQEQIVKRLKSEFYNLNLKRNQVKIRLQEEMEILQKMCEHEYVAESNGDYHKPGYDYTCKKCDHFTMYNPFKRVKLNN